MGLFTSADEKEKIEQEIRSKHLINRTKILNRYLKKEAKLSENAKKLIEEFQVEDQGQSSGVKSQISKGPSEFESEDAM